MDIRIERTKKGYPALWESGGGYTNTGEARIIANYDGTKPVAIYIRKRGERACGDHALIPIEEDMYIIDAQHHRGDFIIKVQRIKEIREAYATVETEHIFSEGEWDTKPPVFLKEAIDSAIKKALHYHCRTPYFVRERSVIL